MSSIPHSEMGISLTTPFLSSSCGPPTPPNSPKESSRSLKHQTSRFRLPKILSKMRLLDSNIPPTAGTVSQNASSASPALNSFNQDESRLAPFRVRQQLPLDQPAVPESIVKPEVMTEAPSRKLRKMPHSYHNLRQNQDGIQSSSQQSTPSNRVPALLPSPLPSDAENQSRRAYFTFQNPRKQATAEAKVAESSYECEGIVAGYCEDVFEYGGKGPESTSAVAADGKQSQRTPPQLQETIRMAVMTRTPPTSNMSATLKSPKRDRSSSLSSEATWLSKKFASPDRSICRNQVESIKMNEKRLAEKARRCCHLVQGPCDDMPTSWAGERKASYATVIKPGKASDIWVPRSTGTKPKHTNFTTRPRHTSSPKTPERKLSEVSAFSPWDSPAECSVSTQASADKEGETRVAAHGNFSISQNDYTPTRKPLFPARNSSLQPVLNVFPTSFSCSSSNSTLTSESSLLESLPESPGGTHHVPRTKCEDLPKVLDLLAQSIHDYPSNLLQLDSAVIIQIRDPQSLDELHIDRLEKIFRSAKKQHLSALAATLIAQSYLANLSLISGPLPSPKQSHLPASSNDQSPNIPTKTTKTSDARSINITSAAEQEGVLRQKVKLVDAALQVMVQKIMVLVCGRYDEMVWRTLTCLVETVEQGC